MIELLNHRRRRYTLQFQYDDILYKHESKSVKELADAKKKLTMSTELYFSKFILPTAPTTSTTTSIIHPNTCKNLLDILRFTLLSSTSNIRGGTAHPGTNVDLLTCSFCRVGSLDTALGAFVGQVEQGQKSPERE